MFRARKSQGFTLIELLLVVVMLGMIGLTIVSTFAGGLKIFDRMERYTATKADVLLSLEKMERDLRSAFPFKGIPFIGEAKKVTFPAILRTASEKGPIEESVGSVSYYRDDSRKERGLSREEKKYALAANKESTERGDVMMLAAIEDIDFQYFTYDPETTTYNWAEGWDKPEAKEDPGAKVKTGGTELILEDTAEELPLGVKIKIRYRDGGKTLTLSRMVFIKTSVSLNLAKKKAAEEKRHSQEADRE
jgi:prepilin-type N-terminal cleavage/methylation domain-containing protein